MIGAFLLLFRISQTASSPSNSGGEPPAYIQPHKPHQQGQGWRESQLYPDSQKKQKAWKRLFKRQMERLFSHGKQTVHAEPPTTPRRFHTTTSEKRRAYLTPPELFRQMNRQYAVSEEVYHAARKSPGRRATSKLRTFLGKVLGRRLASSPSMPSQVDWRKFAMPAGNQGKCMACYAFSATSLLSASYWIATGRPIYFSAQEIIDCSLENWGCVVGMIVHAFNYIIENGLTSEHFYPFIGKKGAACRVELRPEYIQRFAGRKLDWNAVPEAIRKMIEEEEKEAEKEKNHSQGEVGEGLSAPLSEKEGNAQVRQGSMPGGQPAPSIVADLTTPQLSSHQPAVHSASHLPSLQLPLQSRPQSQSIPGRIPPKQTVPPRMLAASASTPLSSRASPHLRSSSFPPLVAHPIDPTAIFVNQSLHTLPKFFELVGYYFLQPGIIPLLDALRDGPVAVLIHVTDSFQDHESGIFMGEDCPPDAEPNHAVVVFGYNLDVPVPYFIFQNSWGPNWQDGGFGMIYTGKIAHGEFGVCGMARTANNVVPIFAEAF